VAAAVLRLFSYGTLLTGALDPQIDRLLAQHCRSRYPASVKRRISSSHGHLSNQAAAQLATELLHPQLAGVVLAHLSEECNRPSLARDVVGTALRKAGWLGHLEVAVQHRPTALLDVEDLRYRRGPSQLTLL